MLTENLLDDADLLSQRLKCTWIVYSHIRQYFAIYLYILLIQTMNELGIAQTVLATRRVNPYNPQTSEIARAFAPVGIAVCSCATYGVPHGAE